MFSVPLFRFNNILRLEEPVVFLYEEATSQVEAQPKQCHEAQEAAQGGADINPVKIQSTDPHQERPKGRNGVTGNGWKYVFHAFANKHFKLKGENIHEHADNPVDCGAAVL